MTLETACALAIAFGLLSHSALLARQSRELTTLLKAAMAHADALSRLVEQLREAHRPDDMATHARVRTEHHGE